MYKSLIKILLLSVILYLGFTARIYQPDKLKNIIHDEASWLLAGQSIFSTGTAESWTIFEKTYGQSRKVKFADKEYKVVKPWMDHPPAFALFAYTAGHIGELNTQTILHNSRIYMIYISICLLFFAALLGWQLAGWKSALLLTATMSFLPSAAVTARIITPENILALFIFIILNLLLLYKKTSARHLLWLLILLILISPLFKLSGIITGLIAGIFFARQQQFKLTFVCLLASFLGVALFALYGLANNWSIFIALLEQHSTRSQSFLNFWSIFFKLDIGHKELKDPAIIAGMLGAFLAIARNNKISELMTPYLISLVFIFLFIAPSEFYGWYKYLCYPLIALGLLHIYESLKEKQFPEIVILFALVLGTLSLSYSQSLVLYKPFLLSTALLFTAISLFKKETFLQKICIGFILISLFFLQYSAIISTLITA